MNDQLITFVTAKLAKKKEVDLNLAAYNYSEENNYEIGFNVYTKEDLKEFKIYPAPTQTSLHQYLREKHKYFIEVKCYFDDVWRAEIFHVKSQSEDLDYRPVDGWVFNGKTPEIVLEQGLRKILRLLNNESKTKQCILNKNT